MSEVADPGIPKQADGQTAAPWPTPSPDERLSHIQSSLLIAQLSECWADNRNFDAILWQIPAAIGAIAGLALNALMLRDPSGGIWVRPAIAAGAAVITLPLIVALVKNRIFQIDRNNWRIGLYRNLLESDPGPARPTDIYPETNAPEGLVLFSSPHLRARIYRGPWYWRFCANNLRKVRAFNVLLSVSLLVFVTEVTLATWFFVDIMVSRWL